MPKTTGTDLLSENNSIIYTQLNPTFANIEQAEEIRIKPTKDDYKKGYLDRYFLTRFNSNDSLIIEVNKSQWNKFKRNSFYKEITLRWKIIGIKENIANINQRIINNFDQKMPGIKKKLQNKLLQFYLREN